MKIRRGLSRFPILLSTLLLSMLAATSTTVRGDDWPGWMGPRRDGVYRETGIIDEIPKSGLPVKWRQPIAGGYSGPAVADGRVFVFDYVKAAGEAVNDPNQRTQLQGSERLAAFDTETGEQLWQYAYECHYSISYPAGPRCTPSVDGEYVYILGSEGDLRCLQTADGQLVWKRNLPEDFSAEVPLWGFTGHPLIEGDKIICMVGGDGQGVVALDKRTGEARWQSLDAKAGYCAPSVIQFGGVRQLIVFHPEALVSLNPNDGSVYWEVPFVPDNGMSVALPMVHGNRMYVSAIYDGSAMIQLMSDPPAASVLWRGEPKEAVHANNSAPLFTDGVVYGTDCVKGNLRAVDSSDGSVLWETFQATRPEETRFIKHGTAFLTRLNDSDRYLLFSEIGDLILATLSPDGYQEHGRFHVLEPTSEAFGRDVVWSHPAYANRTAFIRNDKEIVAVDLSQ